MASSCRLRPSALGTDAVRQAYTAVSNAITLHVQFHVAEIVEMSPAWVFAPTNSAGTTTDHATGKESAEANQELFLFRKVQPRPLADSPLQLLQHQPAEAVTPSSHPANHPRRSRHPLLRPPTI